MPYELHPLFLQKLDVMTKKLYYLILYPVNTINMFKGLIQKYIPIFILNTVNPQSLLYHPAFVDTLIKKKLLIFVEIDYYTLSSYFYSNKDVLAELLSEFLYKTELKELILETNPFKKFQGFKAEIPCLKSYKQEDYILLPYLPREINTKTWISFFSYTNLTFS